MSQLSHKNWLNPGGQVNASSTGASMSSTKTTLVARVARKCRGRSATVRWAYVAGRRAANFWRHRDRRRLAAGVLPPTDLALSKALGYRLLPPGALPEATEIVADAEALLSRAEARLAERRKKKKGKQFLVNLLDPGDLSLDAPLLRLALHPDILNTVVSYLGTVPLLQSVQVFYSGVQEREPISSQLFHSDADDIRQVKIFVLCSRVAEENGPLTILGAEQSDHVRSAIHGYQFRSRLTDDQVEQAAGAGASVVLVGEPGTTCLVDTSRCLHYGSRVKPGAAPRLLAMIQYLTPYAFVLHGNERGRVPYAALATSALSPLQHLILTDRFPPAHR